jgi:hypothetical protein
VTRRERVDALLAELEQLRQRVYLLQAGGVLPAGLRDAKADLAAAQERLLGIL